MRRSLDTNVVVRLIARDDPAQVAEAEQVVASHCVVTPTVLIEVVWVLESVSDASRRDLADSLRQLFSLETVRPPLVDHIDWILERYEAGGDFADLVHLAASQGSSAFVTFDRRLAGQAGPDAPVAVETLTA